MENKTTELAKQDEYLEKIKTISKFSEAPEMSDNPFLPSLGGEISIKRKVAGAENAVASFDMVNPSTGEIESTAEKNIIFMERREVDSNKFIKLYASRIKTMFNLSHTGFNIFLYFLHEMQKKHNINRDLIYFSVGDCIKFCDYKSSNSIYRGLTELISVGFIAKAESPANHFYIDPKTAFNGDRLVIWEEYLRKRDNYFDGPTKELGE